MPSTSQWVAFLVASILFIQVPGPSLLFTLGRALTVRLRDALTSAVGNGLGVVAQVLAVAVGLGALVAASATAYTAIKLVGAAYVVWLGVQAVRHRADARTALEAPAPGGQDGPVGESPARALLTGFLVGVTNPKTLVFFVAFLPQFTDPGGSAFVQLAALGLVFGGLAVCSDSLWAVAAGRARRWFAREPRRLDVMGAAGGTMMVGLGLAMVVAGDGSRA